MVSRGREAGAEVQGLVSRADPASQGRRGIVGVYYNVLMGSR